MYPQKKLDKIAPESAFVQLNSFEIAGINKGTEVRLAYTAVVPPTSKVSHSLLSRLNQKQNNKSIFVILT